MFIGSKHATKRLCYVLVLGFACGMPVLAYVRQEIPALKRVAPSNKELRQPESLREDPRLQKIVSVARRRQTGPLLSELSRVSKVRLTTDERDIQSGEIMLFAEKVPVWQIMDAMAGLGANRWVYQEKTGGYLLMGSRHEYDILLPKNEHERERNAIGIELAALIESTFDNSVKSTLAQDGGIPLGELPTSAREMARRVLWAQVANRLEQGQPQSNLPFRVDVPLPDNATIQFYLKEDKTGYRQYKMNINSSGVGGMGFNFSDYEVRVKERESAMRERRTAQTRGSTPVASIFIYDPEEDVCTSKELENVEALRQKVRLEPARRTYQQAVRALAKQCNIPCATLCERTIEPNKSHPVTFALKEMTLREALDALGERFTGAGEWEWRKSGTLIARQPRLSAHFSSTLGSEKSKPLIPPKSAGRPE